MDRNRWDKMVRVFETAKDMPAAQRAPYVQEECHGDKALQEEILAMLDCPEDTPELTRPLFPVDRFLEAFDAREDPHIGKTIGQYHIKSLIGSGGMGKVYEAYQEHPRRIVALKVLRPDAATKGALKRFHYEAQTMARLNHENIATIYEAGIENLDDHPVPFFAMEYIPKGMDISSYCHRNDLDLESRLRLFVSLCEAVEHGHRKATIHRDLKPGNILVDSSGVLKVIDFGVARGIDSDMASFSDNTHIGQLIGTLQYMSPEQCEGDPKGVDTRSDIYSLGVILFELLTEKLPYETTSSSLPAATRIIQEEKPLRPSKIKARLGGDLETIVLKTLEKKPQDRYQTALELKTDIERQLAGLPILARRAGFLRLSFLFIRRNRMAVALATAAILVLSVFAIQLIRKEWKEEEIIQKRKHLFMAMRTYIQNNNNVDPDDHLRIYELPEGAVPGASGRVLMWLPDLRPPTGSKPMTIHAIHDDGRLEYFPNRFRMPAVLSGPGEKLKWPYVSCMFLADIFPGKPGMELVAVVRSRSYWPSFVGIYDPYRPFEEGPIAEWWHGGHLHACIWNSRKKVLVFRGCSNFIVSSVPTLEDHRRLPTSYTFVLYALKPTLGAKRVLFPLRGTPGNKGKPWEVESGISMILRKVDPERERGVGVALGMVFQPHKASTTALCRLEVVYFREQSKGKLKFYGEIDEKGAVVCPFETRGNPPLEPQDLGLPPLRFQVVGEEDLSRWNRANRGLVRMVKGDLDPENLQNIAAALEKRLKTMPAVPEDQRSILTLAKHKLNDPEWVVSRLWQIVFGDSGPTGDLNSKKVIDLFALLEKLAGQEDGDFLLLSAVRNYRVGDYRGALRLLKKLESNIQHRCKVRYLCFLVMCQVRCGMEDEALSNITLLRFSIAQHFNFPDNQLGQSLVSETIDLLRSHKYDHASKALQEVMDHRLPKRR